MTPNNQALIRSGNRVGFLSLGLLGIAAIIFLIPHASARTKVVAIFIQSPTIPFFCHAGYRGSRWWFLVALVWFVAFVLICLLVI
jgi:hypothetical protein